MSDVADWIKWFFVIGGFGIILTLFTLRSKIRQALSEAKRSEIGEKGDTVKVDAEQVGIANMNVQMLLDINERLVAANAKSEERLTEENRKCLERIAKLELKLVDAEVRNRQEEERHHNEIVTLTTELEEARNVNRAHLIELEMVTQKLTDVQGTVTALQEELARIKGGMSNGSTVG